MSKNNRKTGDLTTVATVVNSANGRTGSRSDSDDGQKNRTLKRASKGQVDIDEAELLAGLGEVRQHDDEQIVFQVVQETADGQHQIVGQLCSEDGTPIGVESEEAGQGTEESEEKQELTDEELQKELQFLLDSQLEGQRNEDESEVAKHLITNREQLHEDDTDGQAEDQQDILDQTDAAVPNKGFSISEIQAFMNNQIKKQHQQQVLDEENENHLQLQQAASSQGQQRHIILVTENGDKIILLQNSSDMENDENSESMVDYQPQIDLDPEEEAHIQTVARERQAAFVSQLEILREKHKRTLHIDVLTPQVPHLQPIKLVPYPKNGLVSTGDEGVEPWTPPNAGSSKRRPPPRTPASVASKQRPSLVNSKAREEVEEPRAPIDLATAP
ncbi:hypothetical protein HDE_02204 [Halotydeus destructor]|nr:hypothetical protein HDE_02204 [Halotydeus destructor]